MAEFTLNGELELEGGETLSSPTLHYTTYGKLNAQKDNVIWVCHALTANSDVFEWWPGLFGHTDLFNPDDHYIICANMIGSCYGSTGPLSSNPITGEKYYHDFPKLTIRDISGLNRQLADHLGIHSIEVLIGGSMGGQQVLEWAIEEPDRIKKVVLMATNAAHSPWGVAYNQAQRMAIEVDPSWKDSSDQAGMNGMRAARATALLSYRTYQSFNETQQSESETIWPDRPVSYMEYQGDKLAKRFNAFSYWTLSKAMDSHNVGRGRGGIERALGSIKAETLVMTLEGDNLFPESEQRLLADNIPSARHVVIESGYGHDGFLIETSKMNVIIREFIASEQEILD